MTDVLAAPFIQATSQGALLEKRVVPVRVLAVVDGTECAGRVTKCLLDLQRWTHAVEVVLLNVQPEPATGRLRGYGGFRRTEIEDRLINDLGQRAVSSAARHLDAAGIAHKDRVEMGEPATTIVRCAEEEKCAMIVVAEPGRNAVSDWLVRKWGLVAHSVASAIVYLARVPVLIAK
jgi:nucleotide-binding universal stress UspA family protein